MSKPRRYHASHNLGDAICYIIIAAAEVFMVAHLLLAIGDGRLP
jgi:hypothetical protein